MARAIKKTEGEESAIGSVTFRKDYWDHRGNSFSKGCTVDIGKIMFSPTGRVYYKVFQTKVWVTDEYVTVHMKKVGCKEKKVSQKRRIYGGSLL